MSEDLRNARIVSKHRKRQYLFQINQTYSIDSTNAGNESRFANHDSNANCRAKSRHIPPGTELCLNYGNYFFDNAGADTDHNISPIAETLDLASDQVLYSLDQHSSDETYAGSESGTTDL
ncbi:hypothetical protein C0995_016322 [Termitomyces sp. Mi166|nr:hypothetical protein C0995_016322 [Termitomyces sp. Mi166\